MRQDGLKLKKYFDISYPVRLPEIRSSGGTLTDGRPFDVVQDPKTGSLRFIYLDNSQYRIEDRIQLENRTILPVELDSAIRQAIVFPAGAIDPGPTAILGAEIKHVFCQYGFSDELGTTLFPFVLADWFPEVCDVQPCLVITGTPIEGARLLRLLRALLRRPIPLSTLGPIEFRAQLHELQATVLIDARHLSRSELNALASFDPELVCPRENSVTKFGFAKAIYSDASTSKKFCPEFALYVNVSPAPPGVPRVDLAAIKSISANMQPKLQGYRLRNLPTVIQSDFDLPQLETESRVLARLLGRCIVDAPEMQEGVRLLLQAREDTVQTDRWTDVTCVIIEVLLAHCHDASARRAHVGKIAEDAEVILKGRCEPTKLEPRAVGTILTKLGFSRKRNSRGIYLALDEKAVERIHRLAFEYRVAAAADGDKSKHCSSCQETFKSGA